MKYLPREGYAVIERDVQMEESQHGSISLSKNSKSDSIRATILELGPPKVSEYGVASDANDLQTGNRILFNIAEAIELDPQKRIYLIEQNHIRCKIID